jgi:hypothetical protein
MHMASTITPRTAPLEGFTQDHAARLCSAFTPELACKSRENPTDRVHAFTFDGKTVEFRWPHHAPAEIWVALFSSPQNRMAGIADLVMFEEATTREGCDRVIDFMQRLGLRYLRWPTRLRRRWVFLGRTRLECFDGEQWKDIYRDFK